jgi:hypothetical protein
VAFITLQGWYEDACFPAVEGSNKELGRSIGDVYKKLELMKVSSVSECKAIWELFSRMFRMEEIEAPIVLPESFKPEVRGWLGNDSKLFEQVTRQVRVSLKLL